MRYLTRAFVPTALFLVVFACRGKQPEPTPAASVRVSEITLGRAIGADKRVTDKTDSFAPRDTIYAVVVTEGSSPSAVLKARWTYGAGQLVDETTQTIAPTGTAVSEFHVSKPDGWPKGNYQVEISLKDAPAGSRSFSVR